MLLAAAAQKIGLSVTEILDMTPRQLIAWLAAHADLQKRINADTSAQAKPGNKRR